jgi:hypothetical protein
MLLSSSFNPFQPLTFKGHEEYEKIYSEIILRLNKLRQDPSEWKKLVNACKKENLERVKGRLKISPSNI